jgi:RNA polymerase sigma-70 factor (ECF subfamily)
MWAGLMGVLAVATLARTKRDGEMGKRLLARDAKVMGELYNRYGRLAYSLILRIVRNTAAAENLTQEAFLHVWNRARAFDAGRGSLGAWIMAVARTLAIDYVRTAEGREAGQPRDLDDLHHPSRFDNIEEDALSAERAGRLKEAFGALTPNQKTVIELAYYEGLTPAEMAARMQQPLGTVKTWVRVALKTLREQAARTAVT